MTTTNEAATLIRMSSRAGASCSRCDVRIERGTYCYAANGRRWHTACPAAAVAAAPSAVAAPVATDPLVAAAILARHSVRLPTYGGPDGEVEADYEYSREG